ncbi:MAG: TIGR02281 family clan AA aspartic protease [Pseudomonadota bacterium]
MFTSTAASLLYLSLLLAYLLYFFLRGNRESRGKMARQLVVWVLIFVGVIAAYGVWEDMRSPLGADRAMVTQSGEIVVPRARDGHYHLTLDVNGKPVRFIVDTGASDMVLTKQDAERVGIDTETLPFYGRARTANGTVATAQVWLDSVGLGPLQDRGVRARVSAGEMPGSLLGMSYLQRFDHIAITGNTLTLTR